MASRLARGLSRSDSEIMLDEYLHNLGFWRKMIPKDGNCLFRIASEKLLCSQIFHEVVKKAFENYYTFQKKLKVKEMASLFQFLSLLMKKDFNIFWASSEMKACTSNSFSEKVTLCTVDDQHFDLVYTFDYVSVSAVCQSVLYEVLYENVFGVCNALEKSKEMMGVKTFSSPNFSLTLLLGFATELSSFSQLNSEYVSSNGSPCARNFIAFPYKVAKSLSVEILRNVEYDAWLEAKKARTYGCQQLTLIERNIPLPGDKCQVTLDGHGDLIFNAHIQEIQKDRGLVVVFVEGLGEKHIVSYDAIKLLAKQGPFDYYWKKRPRKKSCDGCTRNYLLPGMQSRHSVRISRLNSACHTIGQSSKQDGFHALKSIEEGHDSVGMICAKERSCSEGHYGKDFRLDGEDETGFYDLTPGDDEVLIEEDRNISDENTWNYAIESHTRTASTDGGPASPAGASTDGLVNHMVHFVPGLYSTPSGYAVVPTPNGHLISYDNYPGPINFSAPPSTDVNGSDLPSQDISTSRFFYNLGVVTYNGWMMTQNQQVSVQAISSPFICQNGSAGMYVAQTPTVVSHDFIFVANSDSSSGSYVSPNGAAFYYSAAPNTPYIQIGNQMQYNSDQ